MRFVPLVAASMLALAACGTAAPPMADVTTDSAAPDPPVVEGGIPCGSTVCDPGQYCRIPGPMCPGSGECRAIPTGCDPDVDCTCLEYPLHAADSGVVIGCQCVGRQVDHCPGCV